MNKRAYHIIGAILVGIPLLVLAAVVAVQIPSVQNMAAQKALDKVANLLGGNLEVGEININPGGAIFIKDAVVIDKAPYKDVDTVAVIGKLSATISLRSIFSKQGIKLNRVNIEDAMLHITPEPREGKHPLLNLHRVFHLPEPKTDFDEDPPGGPDIFDIRKVKISNFRFRMTNYCPAPTVYSGFGMNFMDLDAVLDDMEAHNLKFSGGIMSAVADKILVREKSGYSAEISARCKAGMGRVEIEDLLLEDSWSKLDMIFVNMYFHNGVAFQDFLNRVKIETRFRPSTIAIQTLAYLGGGALNGNPGVYRISKGHTLGFVKDMTVENLSFTDTYSGISGVAGVRIYGLPDIEKFGLEADIEDFKFTTSQISRFINSWAEGSNLNLGNIAPGRQFSLNAQTEGLLNDLSLTGDLSSAMGSLHISGALKDLLDQEKAMEILASAGTRSFNVGELLGSEAIGDVAFSTNVNLLLDKEDTQIVVDTLRINRAELLGYTYSDINLWAKISDGNLWARVNAADSNFTMKAIANGDLSPKNGVSSYKLVSDISTLNLDRLGLTHSGRDFSTNMSVNLSMSMDKDKMLRGDTRLSNVNLCSTDGIFNVGDIMLDTVVKDSTQHVDINSKLLTATLESDKSVLSMVPDFLNQSARKELPAICPPMENPETPGNYKLSLALNAVNEILEFLKPGAYIENGSKLQAFLQSNGKLDVDMNSGRIAMGRNYIKDVALHLDNLGEKMEGSLKGSVFNTDALSLNNPELKFKADDDHLDLGAFFHGGWNEEDKAEILLDAIASRTEEGNLVLASHTKPSRVTSNGKDWIIDPSDITIEGKKIEVSDFLLHHGKQSLRVTGAMNTGKKDSITAVMNKFNLAVADQFLEKDLNIFGEASGNISYITEPDMAGKLFLNFTLDSLGLGDTRIGDMVITSNLNPEGNGVVFNLANTLEGKKTLGANGTYIFNTKTLDAAANMNEFGIGAAYAFLKDVFDQMSGSVSGEFFAKGKTDNPDISSKDGYLNNVLIKIAMTGAPYTINGPFRIEKDGIKLENIAIQDDEHGSATLNGMLLHNNFKDTKLDARLSFRQLKVVDTPENAANAFYGHMKASGSANVNGPFEALQIDANVTTDGNGDIHVPLSGKLSSTRGQLLTYISHEEEDPYALMLQRIGNTKKSTNDTRIRANVGITEGLNAYMEIDKSVGNVISFNGDGHVNLDIRPSKAVFNLNGDYSITDGKYHFVLPGILEKDLNINEGSSVKFGGDLMDSQIDITATYNLKTSLATLITDTTAVSTRRNVEAGLSISNKLSNPDLNFFINVPDLDPTTKSLVESCLNTEDKIQKQFVALLLLGTFIPSEQSGVFNGANMLYSNLGEIVSSQLNSIFQKLDVPVDLGLSYQQNNRGNNIFDVALSTQLFNNRVTVSGNVGNRQYKTNSASRGDFAGDVDIEIKLDKNGKYRVKLFSHSADSYTNFLDNYQRNGLGFSFQKDFKPAGEDKGNIIIKIDE